jgi:hypothetical protein
MDTRTTGGSGVLMWWVRLVLWQVGGYGFGVLCVRWPRNSPAQPWPEAFRWGLMAIPAALLGWWAAEGRRR